MAARHQHRYGGVVLLWHGLRSRLSGDYAGELLMLEGVG